MAQTDDPNPTKPNDAEAEKAKDTAKRQADGKPTDDGKPDEGVRPDRLTTENDGGSQG